MMKLSEAIRLGAAMTRPCTGTAVIKSLDDEITHTCAQGSALLAVGAFDNPRAATADELVSDGRFTPRKLTGHIVVTFPDEWMPLFNRKEPCPVCHISHNVQRVISHLNDDHLWTREQIACWVESIEQQTAQQEEEQHDQTTRHL